MSESLHRFFARIALALMRWCEVDERDIDWGEFPNIRESIDVYRGPSDELRAE